MAGRKRSCKLVTKAKTVTSFPNRSFPCTCEGSSAAKIEGALGRAVENSGMAHLNSDSNPLLILRRSLALIA
jgi:hypothetical protein